ncbi:MAG: endonuclease/exonuclease/phosphatase family protein [Prevotella sp.]
MLFFLLISASAQEKKFSVYAVGFYNLENLFDTCHDEGKKDYEFLPTGSYKWNEWKYSHKLHNMARVLADMGTDVLPKSVGCTFIGVSEVENSKVLDDLVAQPELSARGYKYCHIEGPDRRGVDCALLYNPKLFTIRDVKLVPYVQELEKDSASYTRGFLTVSGTLANEHVTVIVNHLPSRFHSSFYRESGGRQIRAVKDSLLRDDPMVKIIVMGDMNDDPMDKSMAEALGAKREIKDVGDNDMYNPWWNVLVKENQGTLKYDGKWNLFDQIILSPSLLCLDGKKDYTTLKYFKHNIFRRDYMIQQEGKYKGNPLRTHAGGVWLDGFSDHLPTIVYLVKQQQ